MIIFNNHSYGRQIAQASGCVFNPEADVSICRVEDGELYGGSLFRDYIPTSSMSIHVAAFRLNWITSDLIWVTFDYPFNQLGCRALFGTVPETNKKALDFDLKLGFREVARVSDVFSDGDLVILKMLRDECKWLRIKPKSVRAGR